jgi:hypothetical protein
VREIRAAAALLEIAGPHSDRPALFILTNVEFLSRCLGRLMRLICGSFALVVIVRMIRHGRHR